MYKNMLKIITNLVLVVVGVVSVISSVSGQSEVNTVNRLQQKLMQLQKTEDLAEDNKDAVVLDGLLDEGFIFTGPNGGVSEKKRFIDGVKSDEPVPGHTVSYDDIKSRIYRNTAVLNFLLIEKGRGRDGKDYTNRYRKTVVWVKQKVQWRMAALHVSRVRT